MAKKKKKVSEYQDEAKTLAKETYNFSDEPTINVKPKYDRPKNQYKN